LKLGGKRRAGYCLARVNRVALAVGVVLAGGGIVAIPSPAAASTPTSIIPNWPFANDSYGAPVGSVCNVSFSSLPNVGSGGNDFQQDNTHDGYERYRCEVIGAHGAHLAAAPTTSAGSTIFGPDCASGAGYSDYMTQSINTSAFMVLPMQEPDCMTGMGVQGNSSSVTINATNYNGTGSQWWTVSGVLIYTAGCQAGGSTSATNCGNYGFGNDHNSGGTGYFTANPSRTICESMTINVSTGGSAPWPSDTGRHKCNIYDELPPPVQNRPDGSDPPADSGGTCSFGTVSASYSGSSGATDLRTNASGMFSVGYGDTVHFSSALTRSASSPSFAALQVRKSDGTVLTTVPFTLKPSGVTVTADFAPGTGPGGSVVGVNVRAAFIVLYSSAALAGCQRDWDSIPGDQYSGPPGGGPINTCINNDCTATDITGEGGVLACFDGLFYDVRFFGIGTLPWVHITEVPGDALCFVQRLVIGDASQWSETMAVVSNEFHSSPLAQLADVASTPFVAAQAFADAASGGDCHGPAITYPMANGLTTHVNQTIYPMEACSGMISTAAGIVKVALTVGLWIGTFWLAFRVLAAALGFSVGGALAGGSVDELAGKGAEGRV